MDQGDAGRCEMESGQKTRELGIGKVIHPPVVLYQAVKQR